MKKGYIKILSVEIIITLFLLFNICFFKLLNQYIYVGMWLISFISLLLLVGFEKDKSLYKVDIIQKVLIYCFLYYIIIYLSGLVVGFLRTPYNLSLIGILKNVFYPICFIVLEELFRYEVTSKGKGNKLVFIGIVIIITMFECLLGMNAYNLLSVNGIFKFSALQIIPSLAKNIFLTYLSYKCGFRPTILYRLIMEIPTYFLPIFSNLGEYLEAIISLVFPMLLFIKFNSLFIKEKIHKLNNKKYKRIITLVPLSLIMIIMILMVSGITKFYALAIGSGSMVPTLNVGDVVVIKKLKNNEISSIKLQDIMVYDGGNRTVVHRLVNKVDGGYITKGDFNNDNDNYIVRDNQVIGIVLFKIPIIGYPTVLLSRLMN